MYSGNGEFWGGWVGIGETLIPVPASIHEFFIKIFSLHVPNPKKFLNCVQFGVRIESGSGGTSEMFFSMQHHVAFGWVLKNINTTQSSVNKWYLGQIFLLCYFRHFYLKMCCLRIR